MRRTSICVLMAVLLGPAALVQGQGSALDDALGHAMHHYFASRTDNAQSELAQLIAAGYSDPRLYYFRGLCAWQSGRTTEALQDFSRGAELEQADTQRSPEISAALVRVQGPARRSLENYRGTVRLAMLREREARRLAHYGLGGNQPPANLVASAAPRAAAPPALAPADAEPAAEAGAEPAAEAMPADAKPTDDPFAAPPADSPAADSPVAQPADSPPVVDPFAATPSAPAGAPPVESAPAEGAPAADAATMPAAAADAPPAADAAPAATDTSPAAADAPAAVSDAVPAAADTSTAEGTVAAAIASLDKPEALWELLPSNKQADVKGLINEFGAKMDAELWDRTFAVLNKLVRLGKEKRDLILKQPALAALPVPGGKVQVTQHWDQMMTLLETVLGSEISTVDGLKKLDPPAFLAGTGGSVVALLASASPAGSSDAGGLSIAQLKAAKVSVVSSEGDTATMSIAVEGKPPTEFTLKRIDGKWLPAAMVDGWEQQVATARQALEQMNVAAQKPQAMAMLQMADGVLDQLLGAKDEAAFNAALSPIMALLGQFGGQMPGATPMAPGP